MAFAQGSRTRLTVAQETSFGVLPSTPSFATLPKRTFDFSLGKEILQSDEIEPTRMESILRHGNGSVSGTLATNLRRGDYDVLWESLFFNTFDTNDHLTVGTTPQYLAFEDGAEDIGQYRQFSGCMVSSVSVNIAPNQMVQAEFGIMGRDMVVASSSLDASPTAATAYEPFDSYSGSLLEGGTGTNDGLCLVSSLTFSVTNDVTPEYVILCALNSGRAANMSFGNAVVEGTVTAYYEDATLIDKFLDETESELTVTVDDPTGANGYTFYFPRIKYTGATIPLNDAKSRVISLPFRAIVDPSLGYNLRLTRTSGT